MSVLDGSIQIAVKDLTWFNANQSHELLDGQFLRVGSDLYNGDGVTPLSGLTPLGGSSYTAGNGLSLTGNVFSLGGVLTGNTNLDGAYDFLIGDNIPVNNFFVGSTAWSGFSVNDGTDNTRVDVFPTFARIRSTDGVVTNDFTVTKSNATLLSNLDLSTNKFIGSALQANSSAGGALKANGGSDCMTFGAGSGQNVTFLDGVKLDGGTASRILGTDASKNIEYIATTGIGNLVRATSPTFGTDITTPKVSLGTSFIEWNTAGGNYTGTSIAQANSHFRESATIIDRGVSISLSGTTNTNIGTRLDTAGLRVGRIDSLQSANSIRFRVDGTTADNFLWCTGDTTILWAGSGVPLSLHNRSSSVSPSLYTHKADNTGGNNSISINRWFGSTNNSLQFCRIALGLPSTASVFNSIENQIFLDGKWEQDTLASPTSGHYSHFRIITRNAGVENIAFDARSNGVVINQSLTGINAATASLDIAPSTTALASLRIRSGVAPTTPNDGDIWFDGTDLKLRAGGVTYTIDKT
jgi:hypothetical protein